MATTYQTTIPVPTSETSYTIDVIATNPAGDSVALTSSQTSGEYAAPTNVQLVPGSVQATQFQISFTPIPETPTGYRVYDSGGLIYTHAATTSPITVTGMVAGSTHAGINIRAYDGGGEGVASSPTFTVKMATTAPQSVNKTNVRSSTAQITWSAPVTGTPDKYRVVVAGGATYDDAVSPLSVGGLTPSSSQLVSVYAIVMNGTDEAISAAGTTTLVMAPAAPVWSASPLTTTTTTFNAYWEDVSGATKYRLYRDGVAYGTEPTASEALNVPFTQWATATNVTLVAIDANSNLSDLSSAQVATPQAPAAPASIGTPVAGQTTFDLPTWGTSAGAAYYLVNVDGVDYGTQFTTFPANGVPYTQYNVPTEIRLKACNAGGCSAASTSFQNSTPATPVAPTGMSDDPTPHGYPFTLTWDAMVNADYYQIEIATDIGFTNIVVPATRCDTNSFQVTEALGLLVGKKYYWHVRSVIMGDATPVFGTWSSAKYLLTEIPVPVPVYPLDDETNVPTTPTFDWNPFHYRASVGEIAVVRVSLTGFSWVALADIPSGTTIKFTDRGWISSPAGLRVGTNESVKTVVTSGVVSKGTVTDETMTGLSSSDQIFVFSGDEAGTSESAIGFIYGIDWTGGWETTPPEASSAFTSGLPSALTGASVSLAVGEWYYSGPLTGSRAQIVSNLNNAANWTNASYATWGDTGRGSFTVQGNLPAYYDWEIGDIGGAFDMGTVNAPATSVVYPGTALPTGTSYWWRVRGRTTDVTGAYTPQLDFTTLSVPPEAFDILTPAAGAYLNPASVQFTWQAATGALTYFLQLRFVGSPMHINQDVGLVTSATITLDPGRDYEWQVVASNGLTRTSTTAWRPLFSLTQVPSLDSAVNDSSSQTGGKVVVTWSVTDNSGITGYRVKYGTSTGVYTQTKDVAGLTTTVDGLTNGQPYFFVVCSMRDIHEGGLSGELSATPQDVTAPQPLDITFTAVPEPTGGAVRLAWNVTGSDFDHIKVLRLDGNTAPTDPADPTAAVVIASDPNVSGEFVDNG